MITDRDSEVMDFYHPLIKQINNCNLILFSCYPQLQQQIKLQPLICLIQRMIKVQHSAEDLSSEEDLMFGPI